MAKDTPFTLARNQDYEQSEISGGESKVSALLRPQEQSKQEKLVLQKFREQLTWIGETEQKKKKI